MLRIQMQIMCRGAEDKGKDVRADVLALESDRNLTPAHSGAAALARVLG